MSSPELVLVSSRPSILQYITSLLTPWGIKIRRYPSLSVLFRCVDAPGPFLVDVLQLALRERHRQWASRPPACRCLFLAGWRRDSDQIIRGLNAGIPVSVLEDISADSLRHMASALEPETPPIYRQMGSLTAARLGDLAAMDCPASILTKRESQVLQLLQAGWSNRTMAEHMNVQPKTVKNHLTGLYAKLGVAGSREAIALVSGLHRQGESHASG